MLSALLVAAAVGWAGNEPFKEDVYTVHPFEIKTEYKRVRDFTSCEVKFPDVIYVESRDLEVDLIVYKTWKGEDRKAVGASDSVRFHFLSTSKTWEFLKTHSLSILSGDTRVGPKEEHDGDVRDGYVQESITCGVPFEQFQSLVKSDLIEFAVGTRTFELKGDRVDALRDFARRLAVDSKEANRIDGEHQMLFRRRNIELQEAMDKAIAKARAEVKKLPKKVRAQRGNETGHKILAKEMGPIVQRYHVGRIEYTGLLLNYPEFNASLSYEK